MKSFELFPIHRKKFENPKLRIIDFPDAESKKAWGLEWNYKPWKFQPKYRMEKDLIPTPENWWDLRSVWIRGIPMRLRNRLKSNFTLNSPSIFGRWFFQSDSTYFFIAFRITIRIQIFPTPEKYFKSQTTYYGFSGYVFQKVWGFEWNIKFDCFRRWKIDQI